MLAGGAISWSSALQPLVLLSSTEAEYIALTDAAKEAIWLGTFFKTFHLVLLLHWVQVSHLCPPCI
jgi:hypothetical protein